MSLRTHSTLRRWGTRSLGSAHRLGGHIGRAPQLTVEAPRTQPAILPPCRPHKLASPDPRKVPASSCGPVDQPTRPLSAVTTRAKTSRALWTHGLCCGRYTCVGAGAWTQRKGRLSEGIIEGNHNKPVAAVRAQHARARGRRLERAVIKCQALTDGNYES